MRTRLLPLVLLALGLALLLPSVALAEETWLPEDFTLDTNGEIMAPGFSESGLAKLALDPTVVVPQTADFVPTGVGEGCFSTTVGMTSIYLPPTVTALAEEAFVECRSLVSVAMPGVTSIGEGAFKVCPALTTIGTTPGVVTIDDGVRVIGQGAFEECSSITRVVLPDSCTTLGPWAFAICTGLQTIEMPGVTDIGNGAFEVCSKLQAVTIPEGQTVIGEATFAACEALTSITIPASVTEIGIGAFDGCVGLTSVTFTDGGPNLTTIGEGAFALCSNLPRIVLPAGITKIELSTFEECHGLQEVEVPDGVTAVGDLAFSGIWNLTLVGVRGSYIHQYADENGIPFREKYQEDTRTDANGIVYALRSGAYTVTGFAGAPSAVTIPADLEGIPVASIGIGAFQGCTSLSSITIPEGVTAIEAAAFMGCSGLTGVAIPSTVTHLGGGAFLRCTSLTSITVPAGVTDIGDNTFNGCTSLLSIQLQGPVTDIGRWAFSGCPITGIALPETVAAIGFNAFQYCTNLASISIPAGVEVLGDNMFDGCSALSSVTMPDYGVTEIGGYAFLGCTSLTSLDLPESLVLIGDNAFEGVPLTSIAFGDNVTEVGGFSLAGNTHLTSVTFGSSVNLIGDFAFQGCTGLTSVQFPESLTIVGAGVFSGCTGLTTVTIPAAVTVIEERSFEGCTNLATVNIASTVLRVVGDGAFYGCSSLTGVTLPYPCDVGFATFTGCAPGFAITGYTGSLADLYCQEYSVPFVSLGDVMAQTFTVTFVSNGDTETYSIQVPGGTELAGDNAVVLPTKAGYPTFGGWYVDPTFSDLEFRFYVNGEPPVAEPPEEEEEEPGEGEEGEEEEPGVAEEEEWQRRVYSDMTLYGWWPPTVQYEVATVPGVTYTGTTVADQLMEPGAEFLWPGCGEVGALEAPVWDGYVFVAWYHDYELTTPLDIAEPIISENTTLYAKWAKISAAPANLALEGVSPTSLHLTWDAVTGATSYRVYRSEDPAATSPFVNGFRAVTTGPEFTDTYLETGKTYYYYVVASTDVPILVIGLLASEGMLYVYGPPSAIVPGTPLYKVTFDSQGGTAVEPYYSAVAGVSEALIPEPASPTRDGWDFGGWYMDAEGTDGNEWVFETMPLAGDMTLYAKWVDDVTPPTLTIGGVEASLNGGTPSALAFDADTNTATLPTNRVATDDYTLAFTGATSEALANEMFGLTLIPSEGQTDELTAYYTTRGVPQPYLDYLIAAAGGTEPFAYIDGSDRSLCDGAQWYLGDNKTAMTVPGDFPVGDYTVSGQVADVAGNTATVTFTLAVTDSSPRLDVGGVEATLNGGAAFALEFDSATTTATLPTSRVATDNYTLAFTGASSSEPLQGEKFGLMLIPAEGQTDELTAYYTARGVPEPYLNYLIDAAAGTEPFAYIDGATLTLLDGAQWALVGNPTAMTVPGDFPLGSYTVSGQVVDTNGMAGTVTFTLVIADEEVLALAYLQANTSIAGTLDNLVATFPATIPASIVAEPYVIDSRITLGAALPEGTTVTIARDGVVVLNEIALAGTGPFWFTELFDPDAPRADFDAGYGGATESYSITITRAGNFSDEFTGTVIIESVISKDSFDTEAVLASTTQDILIPANPAGHTLTYTAGEGGALSGELSQTVIHGGDGTPVEAVPDTGYRFVDWSDGITDNPRTDTSVTGDIAVTANFVRVHTLAYLAGPGGTITGVTPQTVDEGASGTAVEAVAATGFHFVNWSDGVSEATRTDTNVTGDITVTANFAEDTVQTAIEFLDASAAGDEPQLWDAQAGGLDALRTMLVTADEYLNGGSSSQAAMETGTLQSLSAAGTAVDDKSLKKAAKVLMEAFARCDGKKGPPDYVDGPARPELAARIQRLIDGLAVAVAPNLAPVVDAGPNVPLARVDGVATFKQGGWFSDPDSSFWTVRVNYGDGSPEEILELVPDLEQGKQFFIMRHDFIRKGTFQVRVTVTDDQGAVGTANVMVRVR